MHRDLAVQGAPEDEPNTHLRHGAWGIGPIVEALVNLGMVFWSEVPDFPESDHLSRSDYTKDGEPVSESAKLYEHARERTLADHGTGDADYIPGIPAHKFSSADGWHITDKECVEALAAYDVSVQAGEPHPDSLSDDVIPFLRTAAKYQGFRVC